MFSNGCVDAVVIIPSACTVAICYTYVVCCVLLFIIEDGGMFSILGAFSIILWTVGEMEGSSFKEVVILGETKVHTVCRIVIHLTTILVSSNWYKKYDCTYVCTALLPLSLCDYPRGA